MARRPVPKGDFTMMTFIARMKIKEGKEEEFVKLAKTLTENVHAHEPETLRYEFFKLKDEPLGYAVFEQFASEAAEEAHRNTPHFHKLAPTLIECLDGTYVREFLDPLE
jgi:autoinducer 2-degrading protein